MDHDKVAEAIRTLRKEKGMTQRALAEAMNLSDRTVSKWERGVGLPDVSLLDKLSGILGVRVDSILRGELDSIQSHGGSMKRISFYVCPHCDNVLMGTGGADISCCGRRLDALEAGNGDEHHGIAVEPMDGEYLITIPHEMTKDHYISFVAYVGYDRAMMVKLYPEQEAQLRLPDTRGGRIYAYCNRHGLWMKPSTVTKRQAEKHVSE